MKTKNRSLFSPSSPTSDSILGRSLLLSYGIISLGALVLVGQQSASAANLTWTWENQTGNGNINDWTKNACWSGNAVPTSDDEAIFAPADTSPTTAGQTLTMPTGAVSVGTLTLNNNYSFALGSQMSSFSATTINRNGTGTVTINSSVSATNVNITAGNLTTTGGLTVSGTLSGGGTIGGAATVNGTHQPGGANTVGTQTFSNTLTYGNNSIFEWDLNANSNATGFDTVSATGNIDASTTGTVFAVKLGGGVTMTNPFWNTPYTTQTWSMASIFGKAINSGAFQSVTTNYDVSSYGSFSISGTNLTWTAVPEPTSALAGILLGAGLLRRRRS